MWNERTQLFRIRTERTIVVIEYFRWRSVPFDISLKAWFTYDGQLSQGVITDGKRHKNTFYYYDNHLGKLRFIWVFSASVLAIVYPKNFVAFVLYANDLHCLSHL